MGIFDMMGGTDYSVGGAIGDYVGGDGTSNLGDSIMDYSGGLDTSSLGEGGGFNFGSLPWGQITNVLGRLGSGALSGASAYQSQQQPNYLMRTNWLGNGLAATGLINNAQNKQNQLDQYLGAGNMLSNLPGNFFGLFNKGTGNSNLGGFDYLGSSSDIYNPNYDDIYNQNYGEIGNAVSKYIGG